MFNYYVLAFYIKYFPGNIYENTFALACSDLIGYLGALIIFKRMSLNYSLMIAQVLSGSGAVMYLIFHGNLGMIPYIVAMTRAGNSMAFNTVYAGNNRLFPTEILSTSFGVINFVSHTIAIAAPILAEVPDPLPFAVFLGNTIAALIAAMFIKERKQYLL